jgi:trimethylamine--corrinoid protein Co-methyltransferase
MAERTIRHIEHTRRIDILSDQELEDIRAASLKVLERTGIEVRSERMLKELGKAGALIDESIGRARFPKEVSLAALAQVPLDLPLSSREPGLDLTLDGTRGYLGVDGNAAEVLDLDTDERRSSTVTDCETGTRVGDALPQIGYIWQPASAREFPVPIEPLKNFQANLHNTGKHVCMMTAVTPEQARAVVEMATIAAGGEIDFWERPIVSAFQCSVSPLVYDGGPLEAAVEFAKAGVPCGFMVMPILAATAPISRAGTLVVSNSEVLAGVIALQLLAPGSRTFFGSCATTMDMRSGAALCGGPEDLVFQMGNAQLARSYGLRSMIGSFASGSKQADWQAGVENGLSAFASWIGGVDMFSGAGLLYAARVFSHAQVVMDAEVFDLVASMAEGVQSTAPEELAVEVIDAAGPGMHFLDQEHTLERMRDVWMSTTFSRNSWEDWEAEGRPIPKEKATDEARRLIAEHQPYPLPEGAAEAIQKVIDDFEAEHVR